MEQISWQTYVISVGFVTGAYYLYVGIRYYRQDIKNTLNRIFQPPDRKPDHQETEENPISQHELEALSKASQTMEEVFDELSGIQATKEEAIAVAREHLAVFTRPVFREGLEQLVVRKAKEVFRLDLTPTDLQKLWE